MVEKGLLMQGLLIQSAVTLTQDRIFFCRQLQPADGGA